MKSTARLFRYVKPYWKLAVIGPALMLVEVVMDLAQPRLLQQIVDVGIAHLDLAYVIRTGLIMVGAALIGAVGGSGNTVLAVRVSHGMGADLRNDLFRKVQSLSFGNLDRLETGSVVTRLTNDVVQIQNVVLTVLRILTRAPLMLVGSLVMAVLTSPRLALLLVALTPIVVIALLWAVKKAHPMFMEVQRKLDRVNGVMQENLAGVRVVKAFVREDHEKKRFGEANEELMAKTIRAVRLMAAVRPVLMLALNFGIVAVIWFGGVQVTRGNIRIGQIMAFVNYLTQSLMSLMMVGMLLVHISRAEASAERMLEILSSEPEVRERPDAIVDFTPEGRVGFDEVTFSYGGADGDPVLKNISFQVEPGEKVAILGATGSGKSSLVHLIPRFYDVSGGCVSVDGVDVRELAKDVLRRRIGTALQVPILFSGTVRENILYGRPNASDREIEEAAEAAQAHRFIRNLPDGYDTRIGQRGVNLSGGQKQRIAIARALITRPAVLILDDCTSAVDLETEARIQEALESVSPDTTRFLIAQRIGSVMGADRILVLEDGRIAGQGTHSELLAANEIYREIYKSQMGNGR